MATRGSDSLRVLIVEDQDEMREFVEEELSELAPPVDIVFASSADVAIAELRQRAYDLVVCDLRIPALEGGADAAVEHGYAVQAFARAQYPGMPILFLTGNASLGQTSDAMARGGIGDLFGDGPEPMVRLVQKNHIVDFSQRVDEMNQRYERLRSIVVEHASEQAEPFDEMVVRAMQIYARRRGATNVTVQRLSGLSGSTALRAEFLDDTGATICRAFAKVGPISKIGDEMARYRDHVQGVLGLRSFAPDAGQVLANLRENAAVFYTVADGYTRSFFDIIGDSEEHVTDAISSVRAALSPWHERQVERVLTVGGLRREFLSDSKLAKLEGVDISFGTPFEENSFGAAFSVHHGDLHCGNVLLDAEGQVLLIDFGDVAERPQGFDAVSLEFSVLFHKESPLRGSGWPRLDQARRWWDLEGYLEGCPVPGFVRACRQWLDAYPHDVVNALVYVHACRQLKYSDVDPALALAVARGASERGRIAE